MQKETDCGIYCIENISTSKKYIGQSKHIRERWNKHKSELNNQSHFNDYLQKAWNKYGPDDFKFYVLEYCSESQLDDKEIYYIEFHNTMDRNNGYNLKSGGQTSTNYYSTETRKKMSESVKKSYTNPERRKIQSANAIKQWSNPEIKTKIMGANNSMYGKHHTEEAKQKVSNANKGRVSKRRNTTPVFCIELNKEFTDATEAGKALSLDGTCILKVCQGKRRTCGGYKWKFIKDKENDIS